MHSAISLTFPTMEKPSTTIERVRRSAARPCPLLPPPDDKRGGGRNREDDDTLPLIGDLLMLCCLLLACMVDGESVDPSEWSPEMRPGDEYSLPPNMAEWMAAMSDETGSRVRQRVFEPMLLSL